MKHSEEFKDAVKRKEVLSVRRAKSIEDNLSSGRKIFRFLLFLNEFSEMHAIIKKRNWNIELKVLKFMSSISSFSYYLLDNLVWIAQIGIFNEIFMPVKKIKKYKDMVSLVKTILEVTVGIYVVVLKRRKEKQLMEKLE